MANTDALSVQDVAIAGLTTVRATPTGLELRTLILQALRDDAQLILLLGSAETGDDRIYYYYHPSAIIDEDHPAYLTYAMTAWPDDTMVATGQPVMTIAIWALTMTTLDSVRTRLVQLLCEDGLLTTDGGKLVRADRIGEHDSYQENTKFFGLTLQFRFGFSKV